MIHTYQHTFQCGLAATVWIDDKQTTFVNNVVKWTKSPYGYNPQLSADYIRWWNYIVVDFHARTKKLVTVPFGNPGTWSSDQ